MFGFMVGMSAASVGATAPADIPTQLPLPPTEPPQPTEMPTAQPQPREEPSPTPEPQPTDPAPTEEPQPTAPPTEEPKPTRRPKRPDPTATPEPSVVPPSPTPAPHINVRVRKTVDVPSAAPGARVVFTLLVENVGAGAAMDVVLSDTLPDSLEVIDLRSGKGDIVVSGQQVTAYPSLLQAGEQSSYQITARVRASVGAGSIINRASITTSTPGDDGGDNTSEVTLLIQLPPTAQPPAPLPPRLPPTSDPDTSGIVWRLLPWALLAVAVAGVGGTLAYSIVGVQNLSAQFSALLGQWTSGNPTRPSGANVGAAGSPLEEPAAPSHDREPLALAELPPLGPPFAPAPPIEPLPPPVALDRESLLRQRKDT